MRRKNPGAQCAGIFLGKPLGMLLAAFEIFRFVLHLVLWEQTLGTPLLASRASVPRASFVRARCAWSCCATRNGPLKSRGCDRVRPRRTLWLLLLLLLLLSQCSCCSRFGGDRCCSCPSRAAPRAEPQGTLQLRQRHADLRLVFSALVLVRDLGLLFAAEEQHLRDSLVRVDLGRQRGGIGNL
jgi:hypothetical protein